MFMSFIAAMFESGREVCNTNLEGEVISTETWKAQC